MAAWCKEQLDNWALRGSAVVGVLGSLFIFYLS